MKKWIILLMGSIVFFIIVLKLLVQTDTECDPPEKPDNVSQKAIWKGGCDGGNWIELVSLDEERIRFRIYRDWDGDLIFDADFKYESCEDFKLTEANWIDHIAYFGNNLVLYENEAVPFKCFLEPIYPAYKEEAIE
jgi:hypothetical protein